MGEIVHRAQTALVGVLVGLGSAGVVSFISSVALDSFPSYADSAAERTGASPTVSPSRQLTSPTERESALALESSRQLARLLAEHSDAVRLRIETDGEPGESIAVPASAMHLFHDLLSEIAKGNAVALMPLQAELTTQQAADALNVSRPFLVRLLDDGTIPCRKVGTHRRVRFDDLMRYKQRIDRDRLETLGELSTQAQELGMGYEP